MNMSINPEGRLVSTLALLPCLAALATAQPAPSSPADAVADDSSVIELSPFEVNTTQDVGYRSTFTTSGTLVREELSNLPSSVSVLNQEFLQDIGSVNIYEASRYATGGEFAQQNDTNFFFRGIQNNWQARNFFIWYLPTDQFSIERLEVVRGPNALLYGDAQAGGLMNIISKRAQTNKDANSVRALVGSWERYRIEADLNRVLIPNKLAARLNLVSQESKDWRDFRYNNNYGAQFSVQYNPFRNTRVRAEVEGGRIDRNTGHGIFADNFSSAATQTIPAGQSWIVVDGQLQQFQGASGSRSTGPTLIMSDNSPIGREYQFVGPDQYQDRSYSQYALYVEQTLFDNLTLEAAFNVQDQQNRGVNFNGANALRRDTATVLPNGNPNPNLNKLYVDKTLNELNISNRTTDLRFSAVYELELGKITTQRLVAFWTQRTDLFDAQNFQERRVANLTNQVFRRNYADAYSAASTGWSIRSGETRRFGAGFWADNEQILSAFSTAAIGSYWDGRIRSLVGYRRDRWDVRAGGIAVQAQSNPAGGTVNENVGFTGVRNRQPLIKDDSLNYGAVAHLLRDYRGMKLSVFGNYSESFRPVSGNIDIRGGSIPPLKGEGQEYGIRLELMQGKVALNYIDYVIDQVNSPIGVSQAVRDEINAMFGAGTVVPVGLNANGDTSTLRSEGHEIELTVNPFPGWTLTANYANNDKQQADVLPVTLPFWNRARTENRPLTEYTALNGLALAQTSNTQLVAPEFEVTWNFFTRYRFREGGLKGFSLGVGANYRDGAYLGVVNNAPFYSKSSTILNGVVGYAGKWRGYDYSINLNVDNVTNERYYVAYAVGAAGWSNPREVRFSTTVKF